MRVRLMSYNIQEGGCGREPALLATIRRVAPDLLLLQEVLDPASAARFGEALGLSVCFARSNAQERNVVLLSRFPVLHHYSYHPFPFGRTLLEALVELAPDLRLSLFGVHLTMLHDLWRRWEMKKVVARIASHQRQHGTTLALVAGDFNSAAPGDPLRLEGLPPLLRLIFTLQFARPTRLAIGHLLAHRFVDCYRRLHPTCAGFTFPAPSPAVRLDYIFTNPALARHLVSCKIYEGTSVHPPASDHLPLVADFHF